jgi:pimeloyl-ACP methyl ester carboxylesterase
MSDIPFFPLTSADGTRIDGIETGEGRPIVVVHGGMSAGRNWQPIGALLRGYHMLALDRRLYNTHSEQKSPHSFAREAEDIAAVLAKLDREALLVGHSSGGVAALEAALVSGGQLTGLALYEPPIQVDSVLGGGAQQEAEAALAAGDARKALEIFFRRMVEFPEDQLLNMMAQPWFDQGMVPQTAAQLQDNRSIIALGVGIDRYRTLNMPVLLLRGEVSPSHLHKRLDGLAAVIPDTRALTLPGQGHNAAPDMLATAIQNFADSLDWS